MTEMSQFWVFTLNNPESDPVLEDYAYLVYQIEQETTVHVQGYVVFNSRKRFTTVKRMLPTAHLERRRGTHLEAKAYCMKTETRIDGPYEFGDDTPFISTNQGKRSDLSDIKILLDSGATLAVVADTHFASFLRYEKGFRSYMLLKSVKRTQPPVVQVYWGETNLGKSRRALWLATQRGAFYMKMKSDNWDGYMGEPTVIINDFYGWLPYDEMLRLLDRYAHQVNCKFGTINFNSPFIIFTSNKHPSQWYDNTKCPYEPLARRLTLVSCMTNPWDETMG